MCLEAVYQIVRQSLRTPGVDVQADRLRPAIGWFEKAWRNTETVQFPERVVFLKTAFKALSGTSKSHRTARFLRKLFEAIPRTAPLDSARLVWSPAERPVHTHTAKNGKTYQITDLEKWFMAFAEARNEIIHEGKSPSLEYSGSNAAYDGHFVFTAEFLGILTCCHLDLISCVPSREPSKNTRRGLEWCSKSARAHNAVQA